MHRITTSVALLFSLSIVISCSGTENTAQQTQKVEDSGTQKSPSWYSNQNVVSEKNVIYGYAIAVDNDSASSVSKAVAWAESELKSEVSNRLENIRSEAMEEAGKGSGLDDPEFLIALRKAEDDISPLVERSNVEVRSVEGYDTYRSFAEIRVPKEGLIERIGDRLSGYEQAWNTIKDSKAFEKF